MTTDDIVSAIWAKTLSGSTTAADRLVTLAKTTGTAGALLLLIGSGATAGATLVDYSGLVTGTAAEHLLTDVASTGGGIGHGKNKKPVYIERDGQVILFKSNAHAAAYLSAEKVIEQAQRADLPKTVKLKLKKAEERIKSAEVIDLNALLSAFQQEEQQRLINEAWAKKAYDELVSFQIHLALEQYLEREEDEEIEAILLLM